MFNRVTTLFVVLAILVCGAPSLHAQSLSPDQEAKLDARLERIIQKANQGELEAAIDRFSERLEKAKRKAASQEKAGTDRSITAEDLQEQRFEKMGFTPKNVKPNARTSDGIPVYEALVHTDDPSALEGRGVRVGSSFDGFSTVRATPGGLQTLAGLESVDRVLSPRRVQLHNDVPAAQAGVRTLNEGVGGTKYTGEGVLACVIDSGIDWDHPDFTDEQGRSNIRYIWDQVRDARGVGPPQFGSFNPQYGDAYNFSDIQSGDVFEVDANGHGTHVTGTVASSGQAYEDSLGAEKFKGMAPDANIVSVKSPLTNTSIIDGLRYCKRVAEKEGKPVVVNMSFGTTFAPHDGTSALAKVVESITNGGSAPGMIPVASAGNSGSNPFHTGPKTAAADDSADVGITVPSYTPGFFGAGFQAALWTYEQQAYSVSVYSPNMEDTLTVQIDDPTAVIDSTISTPNGGITITSSPNATGSANYHNVTIDDFDDSFENPEEVAEGEWTIRVRNEGGTDTQVHGWFFPFPLGITPEGTTFTNGDNLYTLGSPATSKGVIAVGNYVHRSRWSLPNGISVGFSAGIVRDSINSGSSRGPTVDGRQKPEVAASGTYTASALSGDATPAFGPNFVVSDHHQLLAGTSMSSPVVAGTVALLLQEDPTLSVDRARQLLSETARVDDAVQRRGGDWNETFGHGKVNALGALTRLRQGQGTPPMEVLSYHDEPFLFENSVADTLGGPNGADSLALRITPTTAGFVTGAYLSVAGDSVEQTSSGEFVVADSATWLTDSLHVQVYTDDGGTPGTAVGSPVAVPPAKLKPFHSNFVSFSGAGASVDAGTDYHLVVTTGDNEQGSIRMLAETKEDNAGRSMMQDGSSWTSTGNDLAMRAQVSADVFPPAAVAGASIDTGEPGNVELSWSAVDGADQYNVYRDRKPLPKSTSGLTPVGTVASGTTTFTDDEPTAGWTYYYRVAAVNEDGNEGESSAEMETFLYPQNVTADFSRSFGSEATGASGASYRLVAMPGSADQPLAETLDGEAGLDWQAYAESGSGLVQFDGSDTFTMSAGNGFWLTSANAWSSNAEVSTVQLEGDSAATVSLSDGWNIVSNPTDKHVPFSMIQAAHADTLQGMWAFDGAWHSADTMRSAGNGVAYYFNNTAGLDALTIPYPGSPHVGRKAASKAEATPALALSARPEAADVPASTVKMDFVANASNGLDAQDLIAPTGQFEPVSLRLKSPVTGAKQNRDLLVERRPTIDASTSNGHTFDLELNSEVNGPVQIAARNLAAVDGYEVSLIHSSAGETHDLRRTEQVTIDPKGETASLKLAVGTKAYVEGRTEDVVPDEVSFSSYPNPFSQQATVEYALPEAEDVRLVLYDVLGREVAVLENGRKDAGRHTVSLDGGQLSSGVYFGRLKAGDKQLTKKITVVR